MKTYVLLKKILILFAVFSVPGTTVFCFYHSNLKDTEYPEPTKYFYINDYSSVFSEKAEKYIFEQAKAPARPPASDLTFFFST